MLLAAVLLSMQFSSKEVSFQGAGGFTLNGTLLEPIDAKNAPAFVLLSGSGPTDRDDNVNLPTMHLQIDVLKQVAEQLAQNGVATLRFDKRAVHSYSDKWPKDMSQIGTFFSWQNFVDDAKAAHDFLMTQPGIDPTKVGMAGHSEGALIALKVASDPANKVNGLIMLAGQGRTLDVVVMQQLSEKLPGQLAAAHAQDQLSTYMDYAQSAFAELKKEPAVPPNPPGGLAGLFNPSTLVFLHQNLQDDPIKLAAMYPGDALVMNGEFDNQVSPDLDAKALKTAFNARPTGSIQMVIVPGASHAFKSTPDRTTDMMEGPMVPTSLDAITKWCKRYMLGKS